MEVSHFGDVAFHSSRRRFLRMAASGLAFTAFGRLANASDAPVYPFAEVPSSASGITWVHTAGRSATKYLPETSGPGCAFVDYDNDGWMDIYLVNSGRCDFYTPPHPLAERPLPEQSRRHIYRRY